MKKIIFILVTLVSLNSYSFQIKTSPLLPIIGGLSAELGFGVTDNVAVGVGGFAWRFDDGLTEYNASEYHARIDYMFNGVFTQGWYLSAVLSRIDVAVTVSSFNLFGPSSDANGEGSATGFIAIGGYRWQWPTFFIDLGLAYSSYNFDGGTIEVDDGTTTSEVDSPSSISGPSLEFNIGWVF